MDAPADDGQREITCLIVDDHEVVRDGLRISLANSPHIRIVGEASDGEAAVALAERRHPNVVIMDVRMPGMDGLEATKLVTEKAPELARPDLHRLQRAEPARARARVGGEGLHPQGGAARDARAGDREGAAGETFVDPALMTAFLPGREGIEMLTAREREILQLLADGMSNADVAERLFISQETVKSHVRHILTKLEADTRTHAVAIALREAMID